MKLTMYQVDAFSSRLFGGNPAAVLALPGEWLPESMMQRIAMENNLSETAFVVKKDGDYSIRWFTPELEVDLCGHATLAAAHVLFAHEGFQGDEIRFSSRSGVLPVRRDKERYVLDFPSGMPRRVEAEAGLLAVFNGRPVECWRGKGDAMLVFDNEAQVRDLRPDFRALSQVPVRGVIVTAPGADCDFVSRFFAPRVGVDEDPVTGSAHTTLAPYWSGRLGKAELTARQLSKRGGELFCRQLGDRTEIAGRAVTYLVGEIETEA